MRSRSYRRVLIAVVLSALVPIAGCESENDASQGTETTGRAEFGNGPQDKTEPQEDHEATLNDQVDEAVLTSASDVKDLPSDVSEAGRGEAVVAPKPAGTPSERETEADAGSASRDIVAVAEKETTVDPSRFPGGIVPASPDAEPLPGGPRLLVPERNFRTEGRPPALRVNYDDLDLLKVLNMGDPLPADVVDHFPDWLRELDGKTVRLRGFMYPAYQQMLSAFILTRDTGVCCFGPNPKVYYLVGVKLKEGTEVRYIENRPFDVVGTFHIDPRYVDGTWYQLYKISDAVVVD